MDNHDQACLNAAYRKMAELETLLETQTMQIAKIKHMTVALKQMGDRVVELKDQRDEARARIEELEQMLAAALFNVAAGKNRELDLKDALERKDELLAAHRDDRGLVGVPVEPGA